MTLAKSDFTATHHAWVLIVFASMITGMVLAGRRWPKHTRWALIVFGFGGWALSGVYFAAMEEVDPRWSYPIQACDLLALIAPLSVLLAGRFPKALTYFGGFGLTTQAFFTPVVNTGPDTLRFWVFWVLHAEIVLAAIYIVSLERFRPTWRDLRSAVLFWFVYAVAMTAINYQTGWYYGFLGPEIPNGAEDTILKYLGPWPWRPVVMMGLALTIFSVLYLPWVLVRILNSPEAKALVADEPSEA